MLHIILIFLSFLLFGAFILLLGFNIFLKLRIVYKFKKTTEEMKFIKEGVEKFINAQEEEFQEGLDKFIRDVQETDKKYKEKIDAYLLDALELPGTENRDRLVTIARRLDFPSDCLAQIKDRHPAVIALGSRRAGLYNFTEAADDMVAALEFLSSENQFEILMGLARMGRAEAMTQAINKIKNNVIINERGVMEILSSFPGGKEKMKLFRNMIRGDTDYITALFLKAAGKEMVKTLMKDIVTVLHSGNKEIRAAAVHCLAKLGSKAPAEELIHALEDPDWEVRALAAKALGAVKVQEASFALFRVLNDQQWWVRQNAANALTGHPGYEALFILAAESGDEYTRDSIISALENMGSPLLIRSIRVMTA